VGTMVVMLILYCNISMLVLFVKLAWQMLTRDINQLQNVFGKGATV